MRTQSDVGRFPPICGRLIARPEQLLPETRWRRSKSVRLASGEMSFSFALRSKCTSPSSAPLLRHDTRERLAATLSFWDRILPGDDVIAAAAIFASASLA
jgi:hypothetical protein